jgi:hypothetical protein
MNKSGNPQSFIIDDYSKQVEDEITPAINEMIRSGKSVLDISEFLKISLPEAWDLLERNQLDKSLKNRNYWKWSKSECDMLAEKCQQGIPLDDIAKCHGRSLGSISWRMESLGLGSGGQSDHQPVSLDICKLCKSEKLAVTFQCGHMVCKNCSMILALCNQCRRKIVRKQSIKF